MKRETIQRIATPTAIMVGVPDDLAVLCTDALAEGGLRVLKVNHVAAASERIPVVMPQVVLLGSDLRPEEVDVMNDRCVAVGAVIVNVTRDGNRKELIAVLRKEANTALIKALRGR